MAMRSAAASDGGELVAGELHVGGGGVLLEPGESLGAGDRHDPRVLGEQPGERDLCGRGAGRGGDVVQHLDEGHVGGHGVLLEAGDAGPEVAGGERGGRRRWCR